MPVPFVPPDPADAAPPDRERAAVPARRPAVKGPVRSLGLAAALAIGLSCATTLPGADGTATDPESLYAALDVGADWATYRKVSTAPWLSKTHGGRFVEVWVNETAYPAYIGDAPIPVGGIIVKTSLEARGAEPSTEAGPVFVMKKMEPGYDPAHQDWYYAIHWAKPSRSQERALGGPIYWRGKSPKVAYCWKCHENYDRELGGVAQGFEAWKAAPAAPAPGAPAPMSAAP